MKKIITLLITFLLINTFFVGVSAENGGFSIDGKPVTDKDLYGVLSDISAQQDKKDRTVLIVLDRNIDLNSDESLVIPANCSIEIDLNGYNITNSQMVNLPLIENNGVLVINNNNNSIGKIYNSTNHRNYIILNKGILDIENGIIENESSFCSIYNGFNGLTKNSELYINNGKVTSAGDVAIIQYGYSNDYDSFIRIYGGEFTAKEYAIDTIKTDSSYKTTLLINGGSFNAGLDVASEKCVTNATFNANINTTLIAEGSQQSDHKVAATKATKIGDVFYDTILDATNNAKAGETIEVLKNVDESTSNITLPAGVKFDLCGYKVSVASFSYSGTITDSSEIIYIDDYLNYYGRPQGSLEICKITAINDGERNLKKHLIRNLSSSSASVDREFKLPVLHGNTYKFYTVTNYNVQLGKSSEDTPESDTYKENTRFRPVIGFRPNSVWKDILDINSNICIGVLLKNNKDLKTTVSSGLSSASGGIVFSNNLAQDWISTCGYGNFVLNVTCSSSTVSYTYSVKFFIYDKENNYHYYDYNTVVRQ